MVRAFEHHAAEPQEAAMLACLASLRAAIEARDAFPCRETALARDAVARAFLKASGVDPVFGFLQVIAGSRR